MSVRRACLHKSPCDALADEEIAHSPESGGARVYTACTRISCAVLKASQVVVDDGKANSCNHNFRERLWFFHNLPPEA